MKVVARSLGFDARQVDLGLLDVEHALEKKACKLSIAGYYAAKHGHLEIMNLLRELGADVEMTSHLDARRS